MGLGNVASPTAVPTDGRSWRVAPPRAGRDPASSRPHAVVQAALLRCRDARTLTVAPTAA